MDKSTRLDETLAASTKRKQPPRVRPGGETGGGGGTAYLGLRFALDYTEYIPSDEKPQS